MQVHSYSLTYHFDRESREPAEIFSRMSELSAGFTTLDQLILTSLQEDLRTNATLSSVEYGSLRAWITQLLQGIDDKDLAELKWKSIIGKLLVKAKHAVLRFLARGELAKHSDLQELQKELLQYEAETDIQQIAAYKPIQLVELADCLIRINTATSTTTQLESINLGIDGEEKVISKRLVITQERKVEILTSDVQSFHDRTTVLVKKPDYLGTSMWEVIYRNHKETMVMGDLNFLTNFHHNNPHARIQPGDSLEVELDGTLSLGTTGETIQKRFIIRKVNRVIHERPDDQNRIF